MTEPLIALGEIAGFHVADGTCVRGPCTGRKLAPVAIEIVNGVVTLAGQ